VQHSPQLFVPASSLKIFPLDDGIAVFNSLSWDTHLLNDSAAAVLDLLLLAPRTEDEVTALLVELLDEGSRAEAAKHAKTVLGELSHLRLVTSLGSP